MSSINSIQIQSLIIPISNNRKPEQAAAQQQTPGKVSFDEVLKRNMEKPTVSSPAGYKAVSSPVSITERKAIIDIFTEPDVT